MNKTIEFPKSTESWGEVTYMVLCLENNNLFWRMLKKVFKVRSPYAVISLWRKDRRFKVNFMNDKNILNVYSNEIIEWVIAHSPQDAIKVWEETTGEPYDIDNYGEFVKEEDDEFITFFNEDDNILIPSNATKISDNMFRATCREWADTLGRSFFCTTEY